MAEIYVQSIVNNLKLNAKYATDQTVKAFTF